LPGASLSVIPSVVAPGDEFVVLGAGFTPKDEIMLDLVGAWMGARVTIGPPDLKANEYGAFEVKAKMDPLVSEGVFAVKAMDKNGTVATAPLAIKKAAKKE